MDIFQTFFQNRHFFITHIRDLHYKRLDVPSSIPLITQGFSSYPYMMKELRLPLDFSSTLFRLLTSIILSLIYFIIFLLLINEEFVIRVISYFGGSFLPLRQSKAFYKFGFLAGIFGDFRENPNLQHV